MKRKSAFLAASVAALVFIGYLAAFAQTTPPPAPKPGPEHQKLAYFVGNWTTEGEAKPGPFGPGGKVTGKDTCEWFEGHFAVICRSEGKGPTGPMKGIGILSYSPEEKVYTYYGTESSGMAMGSVAKGTVQGDTWTYTSEDMMGGQKMKMRATIKQVSPTVQTFLLEMQGPDGKWVPMMESKGTKVK